MKNRTHKISNRNVSVAICGDIDGFTKDEAVKAGRNLPYEVLINPTHTTRGRWSHLGPKLENLSRDTAVVCVANNDYDHWGGLTTNVCIYVNGKIMKQNETGKITWSMCEIESGTGGISFCPPRTTWHAGLHQAVRATLLPKSK